MSEIHKTAEALLAEFDPENALMQEALDIVLTSDSSLFLTGKAGSGKTTFLHRLKHIVPKRMIVVAPTGVAALNAGGVTIHSFFQLPFAPFRPYRYVESDVMSAESVISEGRPLRFSRQKIEIIRNLDLLIIDEISMVRADLLDGIDDVLRRVRRSDTPFGGVQLLMIGDLYQLAPVVKNGDQQILDTYYQTLFFFGSHALSALAFFCIDLEKVYRQKDSQFIGLLNRVRENRLDAQARALLLTRYKPDFSPSESEGYITLTTHNFLAMRINESRLSALAGAEQHYSAIIEGDFPDYLVPTEPLLILKKGAQVMFCKNDMGQDRKYFNGKIGTVAACEENRVLVVCPGDGEGIWAGYEIWENIKYEINEDTLEISEKVVGRFSQIPLKLAWAITIHKSQGLTFEKLIVDAGSAFAFGQVYVALSRCKTLEGLVLRTMIGAKCLRSHPELERFVGDLGRIFPDKEAVKKGKLAYQRKLLREISDLGELRFGLDDLKKIANLSSETVSRSTGHKLDDILMNLNRDLFHKAISGIDDMIGSWEESLDLEQNGAEHGELAHWASVMENMLTEFVLIPLTGLAYPSGNRTLSRKFNQIRDKCLNLAEIHRAGFAVLQKGFVLIDLMKSRIRITEKKEKKGRNADIRLEMPNMEGPKAVQQTVAEIKAWRKERATRDGVPAYMILSDRTVECLALRCPRNLQELEGVKGIGARKIARFGTELLGFFSCSKSD